MAIYKVVKGKKVEMTATEVKSKIKELKGWNDTQYKRQYNILRNRLRNYERFVRESGGTPEKQSVQQLLYFESKRENVAGYTPSIKMQTIKKFSAQSTSKKITKGVKEKMTKVYEGATNQRFAGLIRENAKAREIANAISDPVKRERALSEYANTLHLKMKQSGIAESKSAIPYGQKIGSTESIDFDYSAYLD